MTKPLKVAALLLLPFLLTYLIFGFIFWDWDVQSWDKAARASYVWISFMFSSFMTAIVGAA